MPPSGQDRSARSRASGKLPISPDSLTPRQSATGGLGVESMFVRIRLRSEGWWIGVVQALAKCFLTNKGARAGFARPASTISDRRDRRRHRLHSRVTLYWRDLGSHERRVECRAVNMSSVGAMVVSREALRVGAVVYVHVKTIQRTGTATVRHCTRRRFRFLVGLEFDELLVRLQ